MADHMWKGKGNHLLLWDKVEIIDRAEHWRTRRLKDSAHMLGYNDLLSRPSMELITIWELIIKKARGKNMNMSTGKKIIHNRSNFGQVRTLSLYVPKIHSELSSRTHGVTVNGVGSLRRQSSGGRRFNLDCRQVTIHKITKLRLRNLDN